MKRKKGMINYHVSKFCFWGVLFTICFEICSGVGKRSTERTKLIPMVTARKDAAQAENDYQQKCCPERKTQRRPRSVGVRWRIIWTFHHNNQFFFYSKNLFHQVPSSEGTIRNKKVSKFQTEKKKRKKIKSAAALAMWENLMWSCLLYEGWEGMEMVRIYKEKK